MSLPATHLSREQRVFRWRIFAATGLAYAGFYFCRKNFSVVMPLLKQDLHFTDKELAWAIFGYNLFYMLGQFANGFLADKWGPRLIVGIGLAVAVSSNLLMGFAAALPMFVVLGCANGFGQSSGWPGLIKNMASWFRHHERGVVMAWWTTCYVLGGYLATIFAAQCISLNWVSEGTRWKLGFWGPAAVLGLVAVGFVIFDRNKPEDVNLPPISNDEISLEPVKEGATPAHEVSPLTEVLRSPAVWITGSMYFFLKLTRYSFLFWLPLYMTERLGYDAKHAGTASAYYELFGFFGTITAGYLSDKLFQSRRFPVGALMLFGLALACLAHPSFATHGAFWNIFGIAIIGFMTYGPDTLMTAAGAMDLGTQRSAATAAGVINGMGSCGQLCSSLLVAYMKTRFGWDAIFYMFVGCAAIGGILLATKWNFGGRAAASR